MKKIVRIVTEIFLFLIFILIYLFNNDFLFKEFFNIVNVYFILRITINLVFLFIKYNFFYKYKNNEFEKVLFEKNVYAHLSLLFFFFSFFKFLRFTFIILFIIFSLLYLLSKVSLNLTKIHKDKLEEIDENYKFNYKNKIENKNEEISTYNLFYVNYNSNLCYQLLEILCNNTFGILNNFLNCSFLIIFDKLCKSNYLFLVQRSMYFGDLDIFCGIINSYLKRLDIKIKIKKDEILKNDSLDISQKRKNFKSTFYHDLEMVDRILNKKNYHIVAIGFYNNNDSFLSISVVTDDIYKKLKNFEKQLES